MSDKKELNKEALGKVSGGQEGNDNPVQGVIWITPVGGTNPQGNSTDGITINSGEI